MPLTSHHDPTALPELLHRAHLSAAQGHLEASRAQAEAAYADAVAMADWACAVDAALWLAKLALNRDQREAAAPWVERAFAHNAEGSAGAGRLAMTWVLWSDLRTGAGDARAAAVGMQRCMLLMEGEMPPSHRLHCFTGLGVLHSRHGMQIQAYAAYSHAWLLVQSLGLEAAESWRPLCNLVEGLLELHRVQRHSQTGEDQATPHDPLKLLAQLRGMASALNSAHLWREYHRLMAAHALMHGDWAGAQRQLSAADHLGGTVTDRRQLEEGLLRAEVAQRAGDPAWRLHLDRLAPLLPDPTRCATFWDVNQHLQSARLRQDVDAIVRWTQRLQALLGAHAQAMLEVQLDGLHAEETDQALHREAAALRDTNRHLHASQVELAHDANSDALTRLGNRRALQTAYTAAQGIGVLVVLDLDRFKAVNDRYGHAVGDAVLQAVAGLLGGGVDPQATVARIGGEEFALWLPGASLGMARRLAARLRAAFAAHEWQTLVPGRGIAASAGVVATRRGERLADALARADQLLYQAKRHRRGRWVIERPAAAPPPQANATRQPPQASDAGRAAAPDGTPPALDAARVALEQDQCAEARALAEAVYHQALADNDSALATLAATFASKAAIYGLDPTLCAQWAERALALPTRATQAGAHAIAWGLWATAQADRGRPHDTVRAMAQSTALLKTGLSPQDEITCLSCVGILYGRFGLHVQAHATFLRAWGVGESVAAPARQLVLLANLIETVALLVATCAEQAPQEAARWVAEGERWLARAREVALLDASERAMAWVWHLTGALAHARGDMASAWAALDAARALDHGEGSALTLEIDMLRALLLHDRGDTQALAHLLPALRKLLPPPADSRGYWGIRYHLHHAQASGDAAEATLWSQRMVALIVVNAQAVLDVKMAEVSATAAANSLRTEVALLRGAHQRLSDSHARLAREATHDALTDLLNRRAMAAAYADHCEGDGVLMLLDLDHFKRINDTHGHGTGDAVLRAVARCLARAVRQGDCVARLGGEEFVLLLPGASLAAALPTAQRVQALVRAHDWQPLLGQASVTLSGGLVAWRRREPLAAVLARADELLYAAKRAGRDRMVCAASSG